MPTVRSHQTSLPRKAFSLSVAWFILTRLYFPLGYIPHAYTGDTLATTEIDKASKLEGSTALKELEHLEATHPSSSPRDEEDAVDEANLIHTPLQAEWQGFRDRPQVSPSFHASVSRHTCNPIFFPSPPLG